ncbi:dTMP kinase [Glutamicibacter protophormiae]
MVPVPPQDASREILAGSIPRTLVIVGTDGAGKTTSAQALASSLERDGFAARFAANVSGRRWLTRRSRAWGLDFPTFTQDFIEAVIRTANVAVNSLRARSFNGLTVMDRHLYCQLVLRRVRGQPLGLLMPWLAHKSVERSLVVVLDVEAKVAYNRIASREDDFETLEYLQSSRLEYLRLAKDNGWSIIDGSQSIRQITAELRFLAGYPAALTRHPAPSPS